MIVILNAAESNKLLSSQSRVWFYNFIRNLTSSKLKGSPIIHLNEKNENGDIVLSERDMEHIKNASKLIILGHGSREDFDTLVDEQNNETSVEQIVTMLSSLNKGDYQISLCSCSGINIGRKLIIKMQEAGLYGKLTARNYIVYPSPFSGKKYNEIGRENKYQSGDYKRIMISTKSGTEEFKLNFSKKNTQGKPTLISVGTPLENLETDKHIIKLLKACLKEIDKPNGMVETYSQYLRRYPMSPGIEQVIDTLDLEDPNLLRSEILRAEFNNLNLQLEYSSTEEGIVQELAKFIIDIIYSNIFHQNWGINIDFYPFYVIDESTGVGNHITNNLANILDVIQEYRLRENKGECVDWILVLNDISTTLAEETSRTEPYQNTFFKVDEETNETTSFYQLIIDNTKELLHKFVPLNKI